MAGAVSFSGIHAKLDRASDLFENLRREADQLLAGYQAAVVKDRFEDGAQVFVLHGAPPVPASWGPLVGDIVHNLRSALDHMAWQLVIASGRTPKRPNTSFPVRTTSPGPGETGPTIRPGIHPALQTLLIEEQPYARFAVADGLNPRKSPLALIVELNNLDKHVDLIPVVSMPEFSSWSVPLDVNVQWLGYPGPLTDGDEVGRLRANPPSDDNFELTLTFSLKAQPTAGFAELGTGDLVRWLLSGANNYFQSVVHRFERAIAELP